MFNRKPRRDTRSPIRENPLPQPGDSLTRRLHLVLDEQIVVWVMMLIFFGFWAVRKWLARLVNLKPSPVLVTVAFFVVLGIAVIRIRKARREVRSIRQGLLGERAVGQI